MTIREVGAVTAGAVSGAVVGWGLLAVGAPYLLALGAVYLVGKGVTGAIPEKEDKK
jgi:hypothetical protein